MPAIPRTLSGKKMEVPVKRLLQGHALAEVAAPGTTADPSALDAFVALPVSGSLRASSRGFDGGGRYPVALEKPPEDPDPWRSMSL